MNFFFPDTNYHPRLTYDASLAELTSLEEMMKIMMEEDQVHHDIINKLWQVYSKFLMFTRRLKNLTCGVNPGSTKPLPAYQRRGAIIILGMLALAKRSVVEEKVDVLLQIGLGKHGKVRQLSPSKHTDVMVLD